MEKIFKNVTTKLTQEDIENINQNILVSERNLCFIKGASKTLSIGWLPIFCFLKKYFRERDSGCGPVRGRDRGREERVLF